MRLLVFLLFVMNSFGALANQESFYPKTQDIISHGHVLKTITVSDVQILYHTPDYKDIYLGAKINGKKIAKKIYRSKSLENGQLEIMTETIHSEGECGELEYVTYYLNADFPVIARGKLGVSNVSIKAVYNFSKDFCESNMESEAIEYVKK